MYPLPYQNKIMLVCRTTEDANVWLRDTYVVTCAGAALEVHLLEQDGGGHDVVRQMLSLSLKAYESRDHEAGRAKTGRVSNVVHGCDVRSKWLACGTASGLVLAFDLRAEPPPVVKLSGHTSVTGFVRLTALCDSPRVVSSSFDKSARLWSLPDGACLQVVKVGTPVLQLVVLPAESAAEADSPRVAMGCGDGTVRVWHSSSRKAGKALITLRFAHKMYVGELRLAPDGSRMLSVSRDGELQLWRADDKVGFVPDPEAMPKRDVSAYWRLELLKSGLVGISARGSIHFWAWGASDPIELQPEGESPALLESPSDTHGEEPATALEGRDAVSGEEPETALVGRDAVSGAEAAAPADAAAPAPGEAAGASSAPEPFTATSGNAPFTAASGNAPFTASSGHAPFTAASSNAPLALPAAVPQAPAPVRLVFVGMRTTGASGATDASSKAKELVVHFFRGLLEGPTVGMPPTSTPTSTLAKDAPPDLPPNAASAASAETIPGLVARLARWCQLAAAEGIEADEVLQQRLCMMESVAAKAGRELGEASVRAFIKRHQATLAPAATDLS
jgi:hypothetical protein